MRERLVLLVDRDEDTRRILGAVFAHSGFRVLAASSGEEALSLLEDHEPDVVVGDFPMEVPGRGRFTTLLRLDSRFRSTPVLSVTARAMAEELAVTSEVADAFLLKPVRPVAVVSAASRLLSVDPVY